MQIISIENMMTEILNDPNSNLGVASREKIIEIRDVIQKISNTKLEDFKLNGNQLLVMSEEFIGSLSKEHRNIEVRDSFNSFAIRFGKGVLIDFLIKEHSV